MLWHCEANQLNRLRTNPMESSYDTFCSICDVKQKGGRPTKRKSHCTGRPSSLSQHIITVACQLPSFNLSQWSQPCRPYMYFLSYSNKKTSGINAFQISRLFYLFSPTNRQCLQYIRLSWVHTNPQVHSSSFTALSPIEERMIKESLVECYQCYRTIKSSSLGKTCDDH